ncbi:MAG: hypothetical protein ACKVW3_00095 [Phycisphaerales bacterium]
MKNRFSLIGSATAATIASAALGQTPDESRALVSELLSDASTRTSAIDAAAYVPTVGGFAAFRYNWNNRNDNNLSDSSTIGFQNALTKIWVTGKVFTDQFGYRIQAQYPRDGGELLLDDAFGTYSPDDDTKITVGQFKTPILREENMSDYKQLAINRSVTHAEFGQGRSQGVMLVHTRGPIRVAAAFTDGLRTNNTDFDSAAEADYAFTGRFDWRCCGDDWAAGDQFTSFRGAPSYGRLGVAAHYQGGGDTFNTADTNTFLSTIDAEFKGSGWNVFGAGVWRCVEPMMGDNIDDFGLLVQGGAFVSDQTEIFGRVDSVIPDGDRVNDDPFTTLTFGINHYVAPESQAFKLTGEVGYFLDEQASSIVAPSTLTGVLPSGDDGQWIVRLQVQFVF